jgi:anti-sigma B factor antagonist
MDLTDGRRAGLAVSSDPAGGLVAELAGELDLASLPDVAAPLDELLARPPQQLLLELRELQFLDSTGITLLVRIANHFQQVRVRHATEPVRRVIEVLGLARRLGLDGA